MGVKKTFILDTNVILHDFKSIFNFEENDVVIPITVLEELDKFKKGADLLNFHAREFMRELDSIAGDNLFSGGVSLGEGRGVLHIETGKPFSQKMEESFEERNADHRILAVAEYWHLKNMETPVVLVSKDINLRMKAKSLGIQAQDYETGKVLSLDSVERSIRVFENFEDTLISRLHKEYEGVPLTDFLFDQEPEPHEYFILRGTASSVLAHYDPYTQTMQRVTKQHISGILARNAEQTFAFDALMRPEIQLVSLTGKAGTGKTLLALAAAIHQKKEFKQIYLSRPIVPLGNRDLGFLPGDAKQKVNPYMQPLFDNLSVIKHQYIHNSKELQKIEQMQKEEELVISPLAYIRGRSLSNVFFIVDEAQNLTPHEVKTIITRAGEGTKMVFTGDIQQIDSPYLDSKSNGLSYLADKMRKQKLFAHINLVKGERSALADLASDLL